MKEILRELRIQRWDDHRYYHHSRINQSLHFVSASSFLCAYVLVFFQPVIACLIGWFVAMTARQSGHFFFEPKGYDHVNQATHEYKEAIKVGYNLRRKVLLYVGVRAGAAAAAGRFDYFGIFGDAEPRAQRGDGLARAGRRRPAVPRRAPLLPARGEDRRGVDAEDPHRPVSRLKLYWKAPLALMRGELIDTSLQKT